MNPLSSHKYHHVFLLQIYEEKIEKGTQFFTLKISCLWLDNLKEAGLNTKRISLYYRAVSLEILNGN
jgi:hypothetical protein